MASKKQQQADQLQQQRPGLLQFAAMLQYRRLLGGGEEAQRGDGVVLAHAVQQVQRHDDARERSQDREELGQREIEEEHRVLLEAAGAGQRPKHRLFDCSGCGNAHVAAAVAQADALDVAGVCVERLRVVARAPRRRSRFRAFRRFRRRSRSSCPSQPGRDLRRPTPAPESTRGRSRPGIAGALTAGVVEEIGNDDEQAALRIGGDEVARDLKVVGAAGGFQLLAETSRLE